MPSMMKRLASAVLIVGIATCAGAAPGVASACSIVAPRIGEVREPHEVVVERLRRAQQRDLWAEADQVFLARVVPFHEEPTAKPYDPVRDGPPKRPEPVRPGAWLTTRFEPVVALKGALPARQVDFRHSKFTDSCGGRPLEDAFAAQEGLLLVVFSRGHYPTQDSVMEALSVETIVDPDIKAALAKAGR